MSSRIPNKSWIKLQFHDKDQQEIIKPDQLKLDENAFPPLIHNRILLDRIQGSIFGMTIGDALGAHVEFRPRSYLQQNPVTDLQGGGTWGLEKGQFTDDTSMALCLANSLIDCQGFVGYDQMVRYAWWYRNGYMSSTGHCFDIGAATRQSIQEFESRQREFAQERGISLEEMDYFSNPDLFDDFNVYCSKEGVAGNGALMRLAPVPLFFHRNPEKAVEYSGKSGQFTHGDKKAYDACRYYGALIVAALQGKTKEELLLNTFYEEHKPWFGEEPLHQDIINIAHGSYKREGGYDDGIRGKGYIVNALEAALWAFWSDKNSFKEGALNAVNLGDDTDTTAAIYGQLAGAYYGYKELPEEWREIIYAKNFVLCVSNWLAYEGELWSTKQLESSTNELLINSDPNQMNNNKTIEIKRSLFSSIDRQSKTSISLGVTNRKAINTDGQIGFLYNACDDCLIESSIIHFDKNQNLADPVIECIVQTGNNIGCQDLLQFMGFHNELRLTLISNIISPSSSIGSIIQYPYSIDECTSIFYYSYYIRQDLTLKDFDKIRKHTEQLTTSIDDATHIITGIDIGIDIIIIFRLKSNQSTTTFNETLNKIKDYLEKNSQLPKKISFEDIISTKIYSNIESLTQLNPSIEFFEKLSQLKNNISAHRPVNYILIPLKTLLPNQLTRDYFPLQPIFQEKIEKFLSGFLWIQKMCKTTLEFDHSNINDNTFIQQQIQKIEEQLNDFIEIFYPQIRILKKFILNMRQTNHSDTNQQNTIFNLEFQKYFEDQMEKLTYSLTSFKEKIYLIEDLHKRGFTYENCSKYQFEQNDNEQIIEKKILENNNSLRFICSNDYLNNTNFTLLNQMILQLLNEKLSNENLNLIYLDFTDSTTYQFQTIKIFPLNNKQIIKSHSNQIEINRQKSIDDDDNTIYILLLGQTKFGKSTLINNFKNSFQLNQNENVIPSIIHPIISFILKIKNEFEERHIQFGICDKNENYDDPNKSITQQCRIYSKELNNINKKLFLIDTPGFDQINDDFIIENILSKIIQLNHLNAICMIIQLNNNYIEYYQKYLKYLNHYFQKEILKNILFCFTDINQDNQNDKQRLHFIQIIIQPFKQSNFILNEQIIFHFDNTFLFYSNMNRFIQNYSSYQSSQQSQSLSKNQWNRLINYIDKNICPYEMKNNPYFLSIQIKQLIRPLLETLRNYFRNLILFKLNYKNCFIELKVKSNFCPFAICHSCKYQSYQYGPFWIIHDNPHLFLNHLCHQCSSKQHQHTFIDYQIIYEYIFKENDQQQLQKFQNLDDLYLYIPTLSYFIIENNEDLFLSYLNNMINQEQYICEQISINEMNISLCHHLQDFKKNYQKTIYDLKNKQDIINHLNIYQIIQHLKQIPMVKIQLDAAKTIKQISL